MKPSEVVKKYGWTQGAFSNSAGQVCALGAFRVAELGISADIEEVPNAPVPTEFAHMREYVAKEREYNKKFTAKARELFPGRVPSEPAAVPYFNDHADTTMEDVLVVMEKLEADDVLH